MRIFTLTAAVGLGTALLCAADMAGQEASAPGEALEARIWLDRGVEPVLRRGDQVRVYYRASQDAFVSIFHIDTNGFARLLHPGSPADDHSVLAGRDYRVLFPESRFWHVDDDEGKGYLFIVAYRPPLDFSGFLYSRYGGGWDISAVAQTGYRDPFLTMDDIVAALIPGGWADDYALDFVAYDIDRPHDFPRFLCYECHGFIPMFDWNPYDHWCTDFRVVIHDDPYYYPVYRYRGDRVVFTRPVAPLRPMFDFKERAGDEPATPLIRTRPGGPPRLGGPRTGRPPAGPEVPGSPTARVPRPDAAGGVRGEATARAGGGLEERPVLRRRPARPPPPEGRPPVRSGDPPAAADTGRSPATRANPVVGSSPPPGSSGPPPAARPAGRAPARGPPGR